MHYHMYISLAGDDRILHYLTHTDTGQLSQRGDYPVFGRPAPLTVHPQGTTLYIGRRETCQISAYTRDPDTGKLIAEDSIPLPSDPCFLATDRTGHYLLSAYYRAGHVAVHALDANGTPLHPPIEWLATGHGAHAIQTDPTNHFAFVPHIASPDGANMILQFLFDPDTGHLRQNTPSNVVPAAGVGPRHYCFHPHHPILYFSNEQGCSVTAYRLDTATGNLTPFQTVPTLPSPFTGQNTCAQIQISPNGRFLYAPNRGHNTIAGFSVDATTGALTPIDWTPTESIPRAFSIDPQGHFLYAAGLKSGILATYRINAESGHLSPLAKSRIGQEPMWILLL